MTINDIAPLHAILVGLCVSVYPARMPCSAMSRALSAFALTIAGIAFGAIACRIATELNNDTVSGSICEAAIKGVVSGAGGVGYIFPIVLSMGMVSSVSCLVIGHIWWLMRPIGQRIQSISNNHCAENSSWQFRVIAVLWYVLLMSVWFRQASAFLQCKVF